ncbi:MAG: hypothetical protein ACP5VQ_02985 [Phycisphaerae bacterium]
MNVEHLAKKSRWMIGTVALFGVASLLGGLVLLVVAAHGMNGPVHASVILAAMTPGILLLGVGVLILCIAGLVSVLMLLSIQAMADDHWQNEQLRGALETHRQLLETIRDSAALSDSAKQIAYRHKDREALRHAIREDIDKNDYDGAYWLASEMERRFGNRQEAGQYRDMVETARKAFIEREIHEALENFDKLLQKFDWLAAVRELDKLTRTFPGHPDVIHASERIQAAKDNHKRMLLKEWKDAVTKEDVDRSVELLKQLDQYLTPGEAEGFKEIARDVFKKQLQQLGVQFALQCNDKNWLEAIRIGQQITDQFPNTRIAAEVREVMPSLRQKSNQPVGAI